MPQHVYFVIDMKSFFASVECAERGLDPMTTKLVVADIERTEKTICLAVSPEMKKLGVKNRCRLFEIPRNIDFIIAKPQMQKYIDYAGEIYSIYLNYLSKDDIHVYSIDECFLDVTSYLKIHKVRAKAFALQLMDEIWQKLKIPSTCGIGTNLYLAKIALDITAKSSVDRIGWLDEEKYLKTLSNHTPITDFWRVSVGTAKRLLKYGITDMEGIRNFDEDTLYKEFGIDAELLIDHAYGIEPCTMKDIKNYKSKSKSISQGQILKEGYKKDDFILVLKEMIQFGTYRLKENHLVTDLIAIYIRYDDMTYSHYSIRIPYRTNLYKYMIDFIIKETNEKVSDKKLIKGINYAFMNVLSDEYESYDLFVNQNEVDKEKKLYDSILKIQTKYGKNALLKGIDFDEKATQRERNKMIGGHRSGN